MVIALLVVSYELIVAICFTEIKMTLSITKHYKDDNLNFYSLIIIF